MKDIVNYLLFCSAIFLCLSVGSTISKAYVYDEIKDQCESFGAFKIRDNIYNCSLAERQIK